MEARVYNKLNGDKDKYLFRYIPVYVWESKRVRYIIIMLRLFNEYTLISYMPYSNNNKIYLFI